MKNHQIKQAFGHLVIHLGIATSCLSVALSSPSTAQAEQQAASQERDQRAQALWDQLHEELSELGERVGDHDSLPEPSLFKPFSNNKKRNQSKITQLTVQLMEGLGGSPLEPLLKKREELISRKQKLNKRLIKLEEESFGAPKEGGLFKKDKHDYEEAIKAKRAEIKALESEYQNLLTEFRLCFESMGVKLSQQQVRDLFSVISGDTMREFFVQFSNMKLLSQVIAHMITTSSAKGYTQQAKRYYAIYLALIHMLIEAHKGTVERIEKLHIPRVRELIVRTRKQLLATEQLMTDPKAISERSTYEQNFELQSTLLKAAQNYEAYLGQQAQQITDARQLLQVKFDAVLNTYQTVSLSSSLLSSIRSGLDDISKLQELTLPELVPLSTDKLHGELTLVTDELNDSPVDQARRR